MVQTGRPSKEHLGPISFKLHTKMFEPGPVEGLELDERPRSWFILVRETLPSRMRRHFTLVKAPKEMDFVEVAHRRIIPPHAGCIASFAADEWHTAILRRTGFYRVVMNTTREELSPGRRVELQSGAVVVKMNVGYMNDDNMADGRSLVD